MTDVDLQPAASPTDLADRLRAIELELEKGIVDGTIYDELHDRDVQRLVAAATKLYVGTLELRGPLEPFPADGALVVTPTEVAATASEMLRALQIEVFELGMWQTRGGL
jgi:hypothetical protein